MGLLAVIGPSMNLNSGLSARSCRSFSKAWVSRQNVRISSSSAGGTDSNLFMGSIFYCHIGGLGPTRNGAAPGVAPGPLHGGWFAPRPHFIHQPAHLPPHLVPRKMDALPVPRQHPLERIQF